MLTERVGESTNLMVLAGDQVRFIGSVEGTQALRVGNREGMVFPAHLTSGGVLLLADLPASEFDGGLQPTSGGPTGSDERPDRGRSAARCASPAGRGYALNNGRTETGRHGRRPDGAHGPTAAPRPPSRSPFPRPGTRGRCCRS